MCKRVVGLFTLLLAACVGQPQPQPSFASSPGGSSFADRSEHIRDLLFEASNYYRELNRARQLKPSPVLRRVAQAHAVDMQQFRYFDHVDRRGGDVMSRVNRAKPNYTTLARENIYWQTPGTGTDARVTFAVLKGFAESPGHRANLLAGDVSEMDFGVVICPENVYVVQILAE